jgi:predicted small lipoprotein YifL
MPQALRNSRRWLAWLLACSMLVSLAACGRKKKAPADTTSIDQPHPPDTVPGATAVATLERTGCYGECPVYRLTVNSDGSVVYVGTRWVKVLGRQVYKLSEAQLLELEAAFDRANFSQLRDYDKVESTDDDWALISYRRAGGLKRVRHYHGDNAAPPALGALEDEFDRIVDSGRFVGVPSVSAAAPATPPPVVPVPVPADSVPSGSAKVPHGSENAAPPDETAADPDNHP